MSSSEAARRGLSASRAVRRLLRTAALIGVLLAVPALAAAQEFDFQVSVLHATPGGSVAKDAARFDRLLRPRVRYEGLRVVEQKGARLAANAIGQVKLPDGQRFRFRPIDPAGPGALVAIDMGRTKGDFRLRAGKPLIFGGSSWRGGDLVVVLELRE